MPDLDDILLALGLVSAAAGVAVAASALLGWLFGVGVGLAVFGALALAGGLMIGRAAPTGDASA